MGMDVDAIVARQAIEKIGKVLLSVEHGEREEITDEIIEFSKKLEKKFGNNVTK